MTTRRVFVAIALTFTACARAPKPAAPHLPDAARSKVSSINDAKAEAALAESTPEGRAYEKALAAWFGPAITPASNKCRAAALERADERYDLVIQLAASGAVRQVLVDPVTPYTACVQAAAGELLFPKPPTDGHWTAAIMWGRQDH